MSAKIGPARWRPLICAAMADEWPAPPASLGRGIHPAGRPRDAGPQMPIRHGGCLAPVLQRTDVSVLAGLRSWLA